MKIYYIKYLFYISEVISSESGEVRGENLFNNLPFSSITIAAFFANMTGLDSIKNTKIGIKIYL